MPKNRGINNKACATGSRKRTIETKHIIQGMGGNREAVLEQR